jgi:hypothetical protein
VSKADDDNVWAGAYGATVVLVVMVGYWLNGGTGGVYAFIGAMVLSVVTFVVWVLVAFTVGILDAGGDPVVVYGCLVIAGAVGGFWMVGNWVLALGVGLGLLVGLWQWRRLVAARRAHADEQHEAPSDTRGA